MEQQLLIIKKIELGNLGNFDQLEIKVLAHIPDDYCFKISQFLSFDLIGRSCFYYVVVVLCWFFADVYVVLCGSELSKSNGRKDMMLDVVSSIEYISSDQQMQKCEFLKKYTNTNTVLLSRRALQTIYVHLMFHVQGARFTVNFFYLININIIRIQKNLIELYLLVNVVVAAVAVAVTFLCYCNCN